MPAPRFLGYQALLGEPKPINWQGVGQALWDSNLNAPIRGAYNLMNADPYTLYTDTGAAGQQAAMDSFDAAGGVAVGSMPIPKPANSLTMGIKAYHGSPHSFDKFSMDKIGTGEGAQAYGHGLYFAENEGVAKGYRDTLTKSSTDGAQTRLKKAGGDVDAAIADLQGRIANYRDNGAPQYADAIEEDLRALVKFKETGEWTPGSMYEVNIDADPNAFLDWDKPLSEQPEAVRKAVARDAGPEFDKAAAEYSAAYDAYMSRPENPTPEETAALERAVEDSYQRMIELRGNGNLTGAGVYHELAKGQPWALGAEELRKAGIPGIKYLDAGSRVPSAMAKKELSEWQAQLPLAEKELADATARGDQWLISRKQAEVQRVKDGIARVSKEADGTRNYVVFDDKLISIVKKYGIAGASAMLGYDVLTGANEAQAKAFNKADLDHRYDNFLKSGGI